MLRPAGEEQAVSEDELREVIKRVLCIMRGLY